MLIKLEPPVFRLPVTGWEAGVDSSDLVENASSDVWVSARSVAASAKVSVRYGAITGATRTGDAIGTTGVRRANERPEGLSTWSEVGAEAAPGGVAGSGCSRSGIYRIRRCKTVEAVVCGVTKYPGAGTTGERTRRYFLGRLSGALVSEAAARNRAGFTDAGAGA